MVRYEPLPLSSQTQPASFPAGERLIFHLISLQTVQILPSGFVYYLKKEKKVYL
jgi:hypothetical protein